MTRLLRLPFEFLYGALDLLYPPVCLVCRASAPVGSYGLCEYCLNRIENLPSSLCLRCGTPLGETASRCRSCRGRNLHFVLARGAARYDGTVKALINLLKYDRTPCAALTLGRLVADQLIAMDLPRLNPILVPVPMHWRRRFGRGYNQAERIARHAGRRTGLTVKDLLRKPRPSPTQVGLSRDARMNAPAGAMILTRSGPVVGRTVCVIDDVLTTAATVSECARVLLGGGAEAVYAVAAARQG